MTEQEKQTNKPTGVKKDTKKGDRFDAYTLLQETIWTIAFLRDVAQGQALNADQDHVGVTPEGEFGLGLLLAKAERDLNKVMDTL